MRCSIVLSSLVGLFLLGVGCGSDKGGNPPDAWPLDAQDGAAVSPPDALADAGQEVSASGSPDAADVPWQEVAAADTQNAAEAAAQDVAGVDAQAGLEAGTGEAGADPGAMASSPLARETPTLDRYGKEQSGDEPVGLRLCPVARAACRSGGPEQLRLLADQHLARPRHGVRRCPGQHGFADAERDARHRPERRLLPLAQLARPAARVEGGRGSETGAKPVREQPRLRCGPGSGQLPPARGERLLGRPHLHVRAAVPRHAGHGLRQRRPPGGLPDPAGHRAARHQCVGKPGNPEPDQRPHPTRCHRFDHADGAGQRHPPEAALVRSVPRDQHEPGDRSPRRTARP